MPELNTAMPRWVVEEHWLNRKNNSGEKFLQGMQLGANIAQRNRQIALEERAMQLKSDAELQQREGMIALGEVMRNATDAGSWDSPETERAVWGVVHKYPWLSKHEAFGAAMDNFTLARRAKLQSSVQESITDRSESAIQSRFDLLTQRLDSMTQLEGVKQDGRVALEGLRGEVNLLRDYLKGGMASDLEAQRQGGRVELKDKDAETRFELQERESVARLDRMRQQLENEITLLGEKTTATEGLKKLQNELDVERDAKRPRSLRPERYDLDESDRMLMQAELKSLQAWRERNAGTKHDAAYEQKLKAIEGKFVGRKKSTTATPTAPVTQPAAAVPSLAERQAGTIYQTPKGPYRWNGSGWEAP